MRHEGPPTGTAGCPPGGRPASWPVVRAATAVEFRMQVRRVVVWAGVGGLATFSLLTWLLLLWAPPSALTGGPDPVQFPLSGRLAEWALEMVVFVPAAVAALLADRLPRDRRLHLDEVFTATAAGLRARLVGKYVGATAATLLPAVAVYLLGAVVIGVHAGSWQAVPLAPMVFATVAFPALLAVAALSVMLPALVPVPVYQVAFVALWMWATLFRPGLLGSPSATFLNPNGWATASALFGARPEHTPVADNLTLALSLLVGAVLLLAPLLVVPRVLAARAARA